MCKVLKSDRTAATDKQTNNPQTTNSPPKILLMLETHMQAFSDCGAESKIVHHLPDWKVKQ